jgi:sigma-B regulation protein RsbU (phosphoserine phosphatase)
MKRKNILYLPLLFLAAFAFSAMAVHYANFYRNLQKAPVQVKLPFSTANGAINSLEPNAETAGFQKGDRVMAIGGRRLDSREIYEQELGKLVFGQDATITVERKVDGETREIPITFKPEKLERNFNYYTLQIISFIFGYVLPTFCILLGFWVVFVRPQDVSAWLLLFIMLGFSSIALEGSANAFLRAYSVTFFGTWALSMLLFGIYFPERWELDKKIPWAKYIFIVPLGLQMIFILLGHLETLFGINALQHLSFLTKPYNQIVMPLNMLAIAVFFIALGWKSGTLKNADARRRLKFMLIGTTVAMAPSFFIILYRIISGAKGSFFDIVPFWFALLALLMMLLFPLTMAYVIVVQRAMNVSVVVRQGLQYAFARNGIKILQFALLIGVGLGVWWTINNYGQNTGAQMAFIVGGVALVPLIDLIAKRLRVWIDRKFFREAYNAEQILSELSEDVRTMVETKPLLETVSTKISESLHVPQVILLLKNGNSFQAAHSLGYENPPSATLSETDKTIEKLKKNETLVIYQDDIDSWIHEEVQPDEREKLNRLNSQLLLPIGAKNELSGVLSLSPKRSEEPYSPNDLRLLKSVAAQTGLALENSRLTEAIATEAAQKERLNRELEIAREVQERLFPQELPPIEGLEYYGACRPALGVGGDYYDFLELPDNKFGIAIGDVSGKGIGASLMMASLQASLRGQAIHCGSDLAALMKHVNTLVYEASTSNRYATFFYAQLDLKTRQMIYVNAGHNPPFLIRAGGEVLTLEEGGAVVGMLPTMFVNYTQGEIQLAAGDLLVGSTDGITEAMNPQEEEWGEDSMLAELKIITEKSPEEILKHIVACADKFADGAKQHDDMTMIILKVN